MKDDTAKSTTSQVLDDRTVPPIEAIQEELPKEITLTSLPNHWSKPKLLDTKLLPVSPLKEDMLPDPLRALVFDIAERLQCPPDFPAVTLISAASSVIGAGCFIKPQEFGDWLVVPNLWGAVIGSVGVMKSPASSEAMRPLAHLESIADKEFECEKVHIKVQSKRDELKRKILDKKLESSLKKPIENEAEIALITEEYTKFEQSICNASHRRYKTNDCTTAKMGELLESNTRGILYFRDELTGFLATLDKAGCDGDRAFYLEGWNGSVTSTFKLDRIERGSHSTPNLCVTILGGIQPSKLKRYLHEAVTGSLNDGLMQRFQLMVYPDITKEYTLIDRKTDQEILNEVNFVFEKLSKTNFTEYGAMCDKDTKSPYFRFSNSDGAQKLFNEWLIELMTRIRSDGEPEILIEHLSKYRKLMPALALIFHLIESVYYKKSEPISIKTVKLAIEWCKFLEIHARRVYGIVQLTTVDAAKNLVKKIQDGKLKDGFTSKNVYDKDWSLLKTVAEVDPVLQLLVESGYLKSELSSPGDKGGRPTTFYRINPRINEVKVGGDDK